ncbi:MAG: response regulator [Planctomycetaceae bacterium]|nr:response regulator [Planctomycetaceae bacterium]
MNKPRILVIDDEPNVIQACKRALKRGGFDVIGTTDPEEALRTVESDDISVIISDQRMPEIQGSALMEKVKRIAPDTVRVILTGYADINAAIDSINSGNVFRYISKPWDDDELRTVISEAAEKYRLTREVQQLQEQVRLQNEQLQEQNLQLQNWNDALEAKVSERTQEVTDLNQQLKKTLMGIINILAEMSERHSTVVGNHSKRVAALSSKVARKLGVTGDDLLQVQVGAMLHDIGKIGLPTEILKKPVMAMSQDEREQLKSHVSRGEVIVRMVPHLEEAARYVLHHHEAWNGSGYPEKLKETDIPLGSRIIAVANAYDRALNNQADYQNTNHAAVMEQLQQQSGTRFDPDVLEALDECLATPKVQEQVVDEVQLKPKNLKVGHVLSRELRTARGVLLLPKESIIQQEHISRLRQFERVEPFLDGLYVYRDRIVPESEIPAKEEAPLAVAETP